MEQRPSEASPVYVGGHLPPGLYELRYEIRHESGMVVEVCRMEQPPFELPAGVGISGLTIESATRGQVAIRETYEDGSWTGAGDVPQVVTHEMTRDYEPAPIFLGDALPNPELEDVPRGPEGWDVVDHHHPAQVARDTIYVFNESASREVSYASGGRVFFDPGFEGAPPLRGPFRSSPATRNRHRERQNEYTARRRARLLLRRFCTPEQWAEYASDERLTVETERSVFVLTQTRSGGVEQIPKSRTRGVPLRHHARTWCIHTPYGFPVEDMILAQKLAIENDERAFLARANPIIGGMGYVGWDMHYDHHHPGRDIVHATYAVPPPSPPPAEPHAGARVVRVDADTRHASNALTGLYDAAAALGEFGRSVRVEIDGMVYRMRAVLSGIVRIGRPPAERGSCCENGETHERDGNWCRRAFRGFFEPIVKEGRLSIEEAREARSEDRSPVPIGSERRRE